MISRLFLLLSLLPVMAYPSEEAFKQYIQPILETRCVSCHGPERQKGGLHLDTLEGALKGGDTGHRTRIGFGRSSEQIAHAAGESAPGCRGSDAGEVEAGHGVVWMSRNSTRNRHQQQA